mmetsp:Transcript_28450/g.80085  ORF Transcript_28450/g.80085 Transcript_28450/m.80085 type:complete len:242 (-) Transcript_28450:544-1269(-)
MRPAVECLQQLINLFHFTLFRTSRSSFVTVTVIVAISIQHRFWEERVSGSHDVTSQSQHTSIFTFQERQPRFLGHPEHPFGDPVIQCGGCPDRPLSVRNRLQPMGPADHAFEGTLVVGEQQRQEVSIRHSLRFRTPAIRVKFLGGIECGILRVIVCCCCCRIVLAQIDTSLFQGFGLCPRCVLFLFGILLEHFFHLVQGIRFAKTSRAHELILLDRNCVRLVHRGALLSHGGINARHSLSP